ncbi:hypothetical protein ACP4J4_02610 [Aureimonas ureilytica]|uniref:hypothetical protein n=1 Tax=Aureimonas ureilytica TaxID=401562 RepID=UPI003CF11545
MPVTTLINEQLAFAIVDRLCTSADFRQALAMMVDEILEKASEEVAPTGAE